MGFSRQEYWNGLPCPAPGDLPRPGIEPTPLKSPALAGRFLTMSATKKPYIIKPTTYQSRGAASFFLLSLPTVFGARFQILPAKLPGDLNHCSRKLRMGGLSFPPLVGLVLFPQPGVTFILFRSLWSKLQSET